MPNVVMSKVMSQRSTLPRLSTRRRHETRALESLHAVPHSSRSNPPIRRNLAYDAPLNGCTSSSDSTTSITAFESTQSESQDSPTSINDTTAMEQSQCDISRSSGTATISATDMTASTSASDVPSSATSIRQQPVSTISHNPGTPVPFRCFPGNKAKRVRFYRNGDQYFKGMWYAISVERVRSFQALLGDLTRTLTDAVNLPHGVRYIFSLDGSHKLSSLEEFEDGEGYVCSSSEIYKRVDYENAREPTWRISLAGSSPTPLMVNSPLKQEPNDFVYPRIITIIRNGVKPRRVVRHLLNKRTARSFLQVIQDITAVVKLDSGAVRKLYALNGKEVTCLADFFGEDDVFIAYGKEKMSVDDFYVVSEESKRLYSLRSRTPRGKPPRRRMPARNETLREDRAGSVVPDSQMSRHLPLLLDSVIHLVRLIGDGNTALVYETMCKKTRERKALKVISYENVIGKEELIRSEIAIMRRISHEFIVQMYDCWEFEGSFYLSLELITGGDLFEYLCQVRHVTERCAAGLLNCLASALDYLHNLNIVHRDVKPENLLVYTCPFTGDLRLKLADFGLAVEMADEPLRVICGTPTYVAPEVLAELGYEYKVDLWAAGVILYVLLCGFPPFQSASGSQEQLFEQILSGRFSFPPPIWDKISYSAKGLIQGLLQLDVEERFSALQILEYPWILGCGLVSDDYEKLMEAAVRANVQKEAQRNALEESDVEFFYSRRTSMDELSESSRRNSSFEYLPNNESSMNNE
ncbi:camk/dcamkl protein kinase [Wuchereria bancrofti]|uniref:Doublecortin-like and CAM kinase-like protein n=1 Tax=Wuchereria bancrofti TaxID=6293 RepID=J9BKY4_WUCBA|nr:camk/dcamkl protein kinase [Wuchereria bancrofti]